jgi:hypothetical protein
MKKIITWVLLGSLIAGSASWFARGFYDDIMIFEGRFHVVNATGDEQNIVITAPSGLSWQATLRPGVSSDFKMKNTGEGGLNVQANGKGFGSIGYVTSHNNLSVIVISESTPVFSQIVKTIPPTKAVRRTP